MWIYEQASGMMVRAQKLLATGYSGNGSGKNNPDAQMIKDIGPIPCGSYYIEGPQNTVTHGPYVLPLIPFPSNGMGGRSGFLIHGDSVTEPGTASEGCIIMPRDAREQIWNSGDHLLMVASHLGLSELPQKETV